MAIIYSYPAIDEISTGDLILVSDSSKNNATKSASVDQLKAYANTGSVTGAYTSFTRTFTGNELVNAFNGNVSDSITLISVPSGKIGFVERAIFIIKGASTGTTNYNANGSLYVFPSGATTSGNQVSILSSALNAGSDYFFNSTNAGNGSDVAALLPVGADIVLGRPSGGSGVTISQGDRDVVLYVIYKILDF